MDFKRYYCSILLVDDLTFSDRNVVKYRKSPQWIYIRTEGTRREGGKNPSEEAHKSRAIIKKVEGRASTFFDVRRVDIRSLERTTVFV